MLFIGIQALRNKWVSEFGNLPDSYIETGYLEGLIRRKMILRGYGKDGKTIFTTRKKKASHVFVVW